MMEILSTSKPKSVLEMAKKSKNPVIRGFADNIESLRDESNFRIKMAFSKLLVAVPVLAYGAYRGFTEHTFLGMSEEPVPTIFVGLSTLSIGVFMSLGIEDLNMAAIARGDANALTVAVASELIAEGRQNKP